MPGCGVKTASRRLMASLSPTTRVPWHIKQPPRPPPSTLTATREQIQTKRFRPLTSTECSAVKSVSLVPCSGN